MQKFEVAESPVMSVAFSRDGRFVLTGNCDNAAHLWDPGTGEELLKFKGHSGPIYSVAFSPDGRYVLTGSEEYASCGSWLLVSIYAEDWRFGEAISVAFSPDGRFLLTARGHRAYGMRQPGR
jgi:WD40 repeat protein